MTTAIGPDIDTHGEEHLPTRHGARGWGIHGRGGAQREPRAAVIVHDATGAAAVGKLGTIGERLSQHRIRYDVLTSGTDRLPDPATVDLVVVTGSDKAAYDDSVSWLPAELTYVRAAVAAGTPVLGICFGGQLLARALGGVVRRADRHELGWYSVTTAEPAAIPAGPWMESHWDQFSVPPGAQRLAWTPSAEQAFRFGPHLGLQFHPEITPTVFETWAAYWQLTGRDRALAEMGVDLSVLRAEIARRSDASRTASYTLFDDFWARARAFARA